LSPTRDGRRRFFNSFELASFFANTATLLQSGVPLIKALEAQSIDETFRKVAAILGDLIRDIRSGSSLADGLAKHPLSFPPMAVSLVRAGERSGTLVTSLERIAEGIEKRQATRSKIRQALAYPVIVVVLGTVAVGFLMVGVVPVFQETYSKAGIPLPAITNVLISVSALVVQTWWMWLGGFVIGVFVYRQTRRHPVVCGFRDRLLIRLPLLGPLIRSIHVGRFVESFGGLLASGVAIKDSLALSQNVVPHCEYAAMIRELKMAVTRGEGIGPKLSEYPRLVPPLLARMLSLGEKSGDLGQMSLQVSRYIEKDVNQKTKHVSTFVEPVLTVAMAFAIGTIALAIYLPMFDMYKQI
jgi:type IV pilus assembly protein PilC